MFCHNVYFSTLLLELWFPAHPLFGCASTGSSDTLTLSHFLFPILCHCQKMLPAASCDAVSDRSTSGSAAGCCPTALDIILTTLLHPPSFQSLYPHSYNTKPSYFAVLILYFFLSIQGCGSLHPWGHSTQAWDRFFSHAPHFSCREPKSGGYHIFPLGSSCEENRCRSCGRTMTN